MALTEADLVRVQELANKATYGIQSVLEKRKQKELEIEHAQAVMREETGRLFNEVVTPTLQAYVEARTNGPAYLRLTLVVMKGMNPVLNLIYHPEKPGETGMDPLTVAIFYEDSGAFRLEYRCDCTFVNGEKKFYLDLDMMTPANILAKLHQIFQHWDSQNGF